MFTVEYSVSGTAEDPTYPFVDGIPSLREAIAIARLYPGIYRDGSATHIHRRVTRRDATADTSGSFTGLTHRWRVFPDGFIEMLLSYNRYANTATGTHIGVDQWLGQLQLPPNFRRERAFDNGKPLAAELSDLVYAASRFGYNKAANALRPLITELNREAFHYTRPAPAPAEGTNETAAPIGALVDRSNPAAAGPRGLRAMAAHLIRTLMP